MVKQAVDGETSTTIAVRVTPRAKKNDSHQILDDGRVKVRLTAPPSIRGPAGRARFPGRAALALSAGELRRRLPL